MKNVRLEKSLITLVIPLVIALLILFSWHSTTGSDDNLPNPPLKDLAAKKHIDIGNFAIRSRIHEPAYNTILTSQFNLALLDNTPNWYFTDGGLRPSKDSFSFDHMDEVVNYAERNGMAMQAHHFVWGEEKWLPEWLKQGGYSKDDLYSLIQEHTKVVGARYAGRIQEWTVVNEAFSRGQHIYGLRDWWADNTGGKQYIEVAFVAARAADPNAVLILNDFGNETINSISNEMYAYTKDAISRGIPIDGIGMQMHIDGTKPPSKEAVIANMKRFGELGVPVYVTEFDVNMQDVTGNTRTKNRIQADIYYDMARACIESDVCKSFAILGITDKETWYNYMGLTQSRPLPFDALYRQKPAFKSLYKAFLQQ